MDKLKCCRCHELKDPNEFYRDKRKPTGRYYECKVCTRKYMRERNKDKPKKTKQRNQIIADHGDWVEVDVSTKKYPNAVMKIDKETSQMLTEISLNNKIFASVLRAYINGQELKDNYRLDVEYTLTKVN